MPASIGSEPLLTPSAKVVASESSGALAAPRVSPRTVTESSKSCRSPGRRLFKQFPNPKEPIVMADLNGFDANQVEPTGDFDPIPAGKYLAVITDSEMKSNKAGTGSLLQLTFQIIEGEYQNRLIWTRLNLDNPNAVAVQIARADLSAICRAVGVPSPKDSVELHNLPLVINVRCKKRNDTGDIVNEIKGYAKREQPTPVASPSQAAPVNNSSPPWKRS
jgi:hypothetical protein